MPLSEVSRLSETLSEPLLSQSPTLSFLSLLDWLFTKENPQIYQGFSAPAEPTKSLEKTEKTLKQPRKFPA